MRPAPRYSALLWHGGPQEQWTADPAQQRGVRLHHLSGRRHQGPACHGPGAQGPRRPAQLAHSACAPACSRAHCAHARWSPAGSCPREHERARNPNWRAVQAPQSSAQQLDPAIVNAPSISTVRPAARPRTSCATLTALLRRECRTATRRPMASRRAATLAGRRPAHPACGGSRRRTLCRPA